MSVLWFSWLATLALGGFLLGLRIGRGEARRACGAMILAVALIGLWAWLLHRPSVAVQALPVWLLTHVEGIGAVPLFMFITGVAWSRAVLPHQKRLTILASFFGGLFFLQGSMWMLQSSPRSVLGNNRFTGEIARQSQDFSCVPAACVTALKQLGIETSEAEMADLTQTRAGTGSTLIRALDGLSRRLAGSSWRAELIEPSLDELSSLQMPLLTPMKYHSQQLHMVTILSVRQGVVLIADPESGILNLWRTEFEKFYTGKVIRFVPVR